MCAILFFFLIVCNKPHANLTIIYENIKEIHILAVGGTLEFPILSHVLLRRDSSSNRAATLQQPFHFCKGSGNKDNHKVWTEFDIGADRTKGCVVSCP